MCNSKTKKKQIQNATAGSYNRVTATSATTSATTTAHARSRRQDNDVLRSTSASTYMQSSMTRLEGTVWKRNAGFLRPWRSRPAVVTDDGYLQYTKKKGDNGKAKAIDLVKSDIAQHVTHLHGHYCISVQSGDSKSFLLGFSSEHDAETWLEVLLEVADENAAGRRTWVANLRRLLALTQLHERAELVREMSDRDWTTEWMFCLRSLKSSDKSLRSRRRRLRRLYAIWIQFHLFAEVLAELFVTTDFRTTATATPSAVQPLQMSSSLAALSDVDSDARSVASSTSSSNSIATVSSIATTAATAQPSDDVDELRLATIRLQASTKSWRGHKRLARDVAALARFRSVVDFVAAERIVDARVLDTLPALPLIAALLVRGVRVVVTAEPHVGSRSGSANTVERLDKRDVAELVQALQRTKMLRAFAYHEVPDVWLRRAPGGGTSSPNKNAERAMTRVTSRYDDALLQTLRSPLVHGVLIRADSRQPLELLSAHDVVELVQHCEPQTVPFLDVVYYVLETPTSRPSGSANTRARALLRTSASLIGDVVVSIDAATSRLPLSLPEPFVLAQQLDVLPLVRRIEDVKTNAARINNASVGSSNTTTNARTPQKVDAGLAVAKTAEMSLKSLYLQSVRTFAASLVTFGDSPGPASSTRSMHQSLESRALFTRSNTEPAAFGAAAAADANSSSADLRTQFRRRRSSLAGTTFGAALASSTNSSSSTNSDGAVDAETYVVDAIHLRAVMRDHGVAMRYLPLVFAAVDSTRQPGVATLVASALVARLAKTLFRFQLLHGGDADATAASAARTQRWQSRNQRAVQLIDSIMHGVFHADLPSGRCDVRECVGEQFWTVDAPTLLLLGPTASSIALDSACMRDGTSVAAYRLVIRSNPSVLLSALLHALDAQLTAHVLPARYENRFVSMPFLRTARDIAFTNAADSVAGDAISVDTSDRTDASAALTLEPQLVWAHTQFFRLHFAGLKRLSSISDIPLASLGSSSSLSSGSLSDSPAKDAPVLHRQPTDSFADTESDSQYFDAVSAHVRQSLGLTQLLRLEQSVCAWDTAHALRSRLVKALRVAARKDGDGNEGDDDDNRRNTVMRAYCDEAYELLDGAAAATTLRVPVEYLIALECLLVVASSDDQQLLRGDAWMRVVAALAFFYRPASQAQFAQSASAHPLSAIIAFMVELGSGGSQHHDSRRSQLQRAQVQQRWLDVIDAVDAHCRRAVARSWTLDAVTSIATKTASLAFEKTRGGVGPVAGSGSVGVGVSVSSSLSSLSSAVSDDRNGDAAATTETPQFAKTARALSTESPVVVSAVAMRRDVLWFVESFLLPSLRDSSWWLTRNAFDRIVTKAAKMTSVSTTPTPGVALIWGEPLGLSLDDESQIAEAPRGSRLGDLAPRPSATALDSIAVLTLPSALRRVVYVACGYRHTALVADNRQLYTFGVGECGRLGHGDEIAVTTPTRVQYFARRIDAVGANVDGVAHVACGREHTLAVLVNGELYGFGWAEAGRLGTDDTGCVATPTRVTALEHVNVQAAACGREHSLALTTAGHVYAFGAGFGGRLGTGSESDEELPVRVLGALADVTVARIDAGECHSAAVSDAGDVFTWGFGSSGALGTGSRENELLPTKVADTAWTHSSDVDGAVATVTGVACGGYHTLVSTSTGKLYGWGDSAAGQLGAEHLASPDMVVLAPAEIRLPTVEGGTAGAAAVRDVASGTFTSAVCTADGRVFQWGSAAAGNGAVLQRKHADVTCVTALDEFAVARIACGAYHTVAVTRGLEYA